MFYVKNRKCSTFKNVHTFTRFTTNVNHALHKSNNLKLQLEHYDIF